MRKSPEMAETIRTLQLSVDQAAVNQRATGQPMNASKNTSRKLKRCSGSWRRPRWSASARFDNCRQKMKLLRMHLKLAVDSLKNPIPAVTLEQRKPSIVPVPEENQPPSHDSDDCEGSPASMPSLTWMSGRMMIPSLTMPTSKRLTECKTTCMTFSVI